LIKFFIMNNSVDILGVAVDRVTQKEVLSIIDKLTSTQTFSYVTTPNPEMVMRAQKDHEFMTALNGADLLIPDGVGLQMAAELLTTNVSRNAVVRFFQIVWHGMSIGFAHRYHVLPQRVSGVDVVFDLIKRYSHGEKSFFLLGGSQETVVKAKDMLQQKYPLVSIVGAESGGIISSDGVGEYDEQTLQKISNASPDIIIVAFGAPKQEKWLYRNKGRISKGVALGVGATIDFIAGEQKRAPNFFRKYHLEWLWRLVSEPKRAKRIATAFPVFPLYVAVRKFFMLQ